MNPEEEALRASASDLRRWVGEIEQRTPENALPVRAASAAVTFLTGQGKLIATSGFLGCVTIHAEGAEIDFPALARWADETEAASQVDPRIPGWEGVPAARMACLLAGHVPPHPVGSDEAENWTPACIAYDMTERNGDCWDDAAVLAAVAELLLGRRRFGC